MPLLESATLVTEEMSRPVSLASRLSTQAKTSRYHASVEAPPAIAWRDLSVSSGRAILRCPAFSIDHMTASLLLLKPQFRVESPICLN